MTKEDQLRALGYEPTRELLSIMDNLPGDHGKHKARMYLERNPDPKLAQLWGVRVAGMASVRVQSYVEYVASLAQELAEAAEAYREAVVSGEGKFSEVGRRLRAAHADYKSAMSALIQAKGL